MGDMIVDPNAQCVFSQAVVLMCPFCYMIAAIMSLAVHKKVEPL